MGSSDDVKSVMIIAGEASGDMHGAKLVRAMWNKRKKMVFFGIGGQALKNTGVNVLMDSSLISVVGITEIVPKIPHILNGMALARELLKKIRPDLLILIDFPDFNLRVAEHAKKLDIPVLYYISPQIWAWRPGRVKKIGNLVDHVAVILPFEEKFYRKHNVPATFVGHPLLDSGHICHIDPGSNGSGSSIRPDNENSDNPLTIGLLPGSRDREVTSLLPDMIRAANIIGKKHPEIRFLVSVAPSVENRLVKEVAEQAGISAKIDFWEKGVEEIFEQSALVIAASGTVTLQSAIYKTPMVVIYKVSFLSYLIGRLMIRVDHISLVNLIAEARIAPELIQDEASGENIAQTVLNIIDTPGRLNIMKRQLSGIRNRLGGSGASSKVADIAIDMLHKFHMGGK
ncbi:lipid-A-disaccharide synthase [Desulfobacterales bacterium HSG16]|nr:lipid-A-disaccharide synthase [Desulfobacterales bacterium HSG16]